MDWVNQDRFFKNAQQCIEHICKQDVWLVHLKFKKFWDLSRRSGFNYTNMFTLSFYLSKSQKLKCFFEILRSAITNAVCKCWWNRPLICHAGGRRWWRRLHQLRRVLHDGLEHHEPGKFTAYIWTEEKEEVNHFKSFFLHQYSLFAKISFTVKAA